MNFFSVLPSFVDHCLLGTRIICLKNAATEHELEDDDEKIGEDYFICIVVFIAGWYHQPQYKYLY